MIPWSELNKGTKGAIAITATVIAVVIILGLIGYFTGAWDAVR